MCVLTFDQRIKMAIVQIFLFLALFGCIVYADTPFKPCNPDEPIYKSIEILNSHCINSTPCAFRRGTNASLSASFVPEENHRKMYIVMYFDLNGVRINYEGEHHANICDNIYSYPDKVKVGCPIEKGKRYIYERSIRIIPNVPKLPRVIVHWAIRDFDTKKDVVCYDLIAKVI